MNLRLATLDDLDELQDLFVQTIKKWCKKDYNPVQISAWITSVKDKEKWKSIISNQYFLIAEKDNRIVGYSSLDKGNYLDFMYVHKDYMRQGIASLLFKKIKAKANELGVEQLTSDVSITALPFFKSIGFKIVKKNKNIISGVEIINYRMTV